MSDIKPHLLGIRRFYLQQRKENGPWCISDWFPLDCYRVQDAREANEWIEAKKAFGFELTPIQETLLELHRRERARAA